MRVVLSLVLLPLLSQPVLAATASDGASAHAHHARKTWEQRFTEANGAHDGHLTPKEAKAGYATVSKHFDEIDVDHKGYVTEDDIRTWRSKHKSVHHKAHAAKDGVAPQDNSQLAPAPGKTLAAGGSSSHTTDAAPAHGDQAATE